MRSLHKVLIGWECIHMRSLHRILIDSVVIFLEWDTNVLESFKHPVSEAVSESHCKLEKPTVDTYQRELDSPTHLFAQGLDNIIQTWEGFWVHLGQDTGHLTKQLSCQEGLKATEQKRVTQSISVLMHLLVSGMRYPASLTEMQNISEGLHPGCQSTSQHQEPCGTEPFCSCLLCFSPSILNR